MFVDPGAFINMFMGVGVLKVKGLFRKLRKLSLRYGGVIVFFDEADSLGNRGMRHRRRARRQQRGRPRSTRHGCHGFSYLSPDMPVRCSPETRSQRVAGGDRLAARGTSRWSAG